LQVPLSRTGLLAIGGASLSAVLSAALVAQRHGDWGNDAIGIVVVLIVLLLGIFVQTLAIARLAGSPRVNPRRHQRLDALLAVGAVVGAGSVWLSFHGGPHGLAAPFGLAFQWIMTILGRYRFAP
jgi:hypothetical protein